MIEKAPCREQEHPHREEQPRSKQEVSGSTHAPAKEAIGTSISHRPEAIEGIRDRSEQDYGEKPEVESERSPGELRQKPQQPQTGQSFQKQHRVVDNPQLLPGCPYVLHIACTLVHAFPVNARPTSSIYRKSKFTSAVSPSPRETIFDCSLTGMKTFASWS